jgi:hypothetical protein
VDRLELFLTAVTFAVRGGCWHGRTFQMDPKRCRENLNLKSAILSRITGFIRAHRLRFQMHITAHRTKAWRHGRSS